MKKIFYTIFILLAACSTDSTEELNINSNLNKVDLKVDQEKILVCHQGDDGWKIIDVNPNSIEGHLGHGDVRLDDQDGDGFVPDNECGYGNMGDCNDHNAYVNPAMEEICGNGIDDDCDGEIDEENCLGVGDEFQGGILAYIFKEGDPGYVEGEFHGIVTTKTNQGKAPWGCLREIDGADGMKLLDGRKNTRDILSKCSSSTENIAAKIADDLVVGEYSDWVLPSVDELHKLYESKELIKNFPSDKETDDKYYWTSTEYVGFQAYRIRFTTGLADKAGKFKEYWVRPVRYF